MEPPFSSMDGTNALLADEKIDKSERAVVDGRDVAVSGGDCEQKPKTARGTLPL